MAEDINKKIAIDVEVNTDGQQQIAQYKTALDNLRISVANLSNPFSGLSGSISNLDKDMQKLTGSIDKLNKQNQDLSSGGNKVKSTVLEVISTFGGLSKIMEIAKGATAAFEAELTAGLSILIAFIPEIIDWVGALFKGNTTLSALNKTLKDNKIVMDAVNQAKAQGKDDAQQEQYCCIGNYDLFWP
jgi:chromosome segregation ATPase